MSIINTSDKSIKNSPFNNINQGGGVPENPFEGLTLNVREADYLSTRSAIFVAFIAAAVCMLVPSFDVNLKTYLMSLLWAVGFTVVYVLFWSVSLRLFESPDTMPLSVALNIVPAVLGSIFLKEHIPLLGASLIASGLSALTVVSAEEKKRKVDSKGFKDVDFLNGEFIKYSEFVKADVTNEIMLPMLCSVFASVIGVTGAAFLHKKTGAEGRGLSILISALILMGMSFVISKIRGKDYLLSSSMLSDSSELPSIRFKSLRSFLLRRLRFFLSFVIMGAGSLIFDYIDRSFSLGLSFMKYILCALMIFAFAFLRGRHSRHRIQFVAELCIIYAVVLTSCHTVIDLVVLVLFTTLVDILITGLMLTYNRRLIMSRRSPYVEGMPLSLMAVALIFMTCEVLLGYWGIMI